MYEEKFQGKYEKLDEDIRTKERNELKMTHVELFGDMNPISVGCRRSLFVLQCVANNGTSLFGPVLQSNCYGG